MEKKQKPRNTSTPLLKQGQCGTKFCRKIHVPACTRLFTGLKLWKKLVLA